VSRNPLAPLNKDVTSPPFQAVVELAKAAAGPAVVVLVGVTLEPGAQQRGLVSQADIGKVT